MESIFYFRVRSTSTFLGTQDLKTVMDKQLALSTPLWMPKNPRDSSQRIKHQQLHLGVILLLTLHMTNTPQPINILILSPYIHKPSNGDAFLMSKKH